MSSSTSSEACCAACYKPQSVLSEPLKKCAGCLKVAYCTKKCQAGAWTVHRAACKATRAEGKRATDILSGTPSIRNADKPFVPGPDFYEKRLVRCSILGNAGDVPAEYAEVTSGTSSRPPAPPGYAYAPSYAELAAQIVEAVKANHADLATLNDDTPLSIAARASFALLHPNKPAKTYLSSLPQRDALVQIVDCYRLRMDDEYVYALDNQGVYQDEDPVPVFNDYLDRAERRKVLPDWWDASMRAGLLQMVLLPAADYWLSIYQIAPKWRILDLHEKNKYVPHILRELGNRIYGKPVENYRPLSK